MPVPLILLAAGRSTRFGALKQVAPVGPAGASILTYTVLDALVSGFSEVVLVVRPEIEDTIRKHLEVYLGAGLPIRFVHQPEPFGTAHAALLALAGIDGPAGIANGDDFYGRAALTQLRQSADALSEEKNSGEKVRCALVAYPIASTLSEHGGVSRGWVQTDGNAVTSIEEIYDVRADAGAPESATLRGRSTSGEARTMPSDALGSMNLWMLDRGIGPILAREFAVRQAADDGKEFLLSAVLDGLRASGDIAISVGGTAKGWFGLTFAADLPAAAERMAAAHAAGQYVDPLSRHVDPYRSL